MVADLQARCCQGCVPCSSDFKKVVDLPYSGLVIYVHRRAEDQKETVRPDNEGEGIIFHNTTSKEINKPSYISELCQYKTKYSHIKIIIKRVRSLLDEIVVIKGNQVLGICDHCKRLNTTKKCRKCDYMVREFLADKQKKNEERELRFKEWLLKVKKLLQSILNAHSVCKHMAYKDTELQRILKELKTPLSMRMPDIVLFPNVEKDHFVSQSITESKEMLEELLSRIQSEGLQKPVLSNDSLYPSPSDYKETCICKLVKEGHFLEKEISTLSIEKPESQPETNLKTYSTMLYTDVIQKLIDLRRALLLDAFKSADKILVQNLVKSINHINKHGLLPESAKKLIDQITELNKTLSPLEKSGRYKDLIDSLLADLKKCVIVSEGFSKHLLKVLVDVCKNTADEVSKGAGITQTKKPSTKFTPQQYLVKKSKEGLTSNESQLIPKDAKEKIEEGRRGPENLVSRLQHRLSDTRDEVPQKVEREGRERVDGVPRREKEGDKSFASESTPRLVKDVPKDGKHLPKHAVSQLIKDEDKALFKDATSRILKEGGKTIPKETGSRILKDESKDTTSRLPKEIGKAMPKDTVSRILKDDDKAMPKDAASRVLREAGKAKESVSQIAKDGKSLLKDTSSRKNIPKETEATPKLRSKEEDKILSKDKPKELGKSLPKGRVAEPPKDKQKVRGDTLPKPGKNEIEKDGPDDVLKQRLLELGRALSQGLSQALDKDVVRELSNNLKQAITKDTKNVTKGVIEALTSVCKVLAKGIPKNLNKSPVLDLLEDMNEIFVRGLASDKNKENLQSKLTELSKALTQTIPLDAEENSSKLQAAEALKDKPKASEKSLVKGETKEKQKNTGDILPKTGRRDEKEGKKDIDKNKERRKSLENKSPTSGELTTGSKGTTKEKKTDLSIYAHEAQKKMQTDRDKALRKEKEVKVLPKPSITEKKTEIIETIEDKKAKHIKEAKSVQIVKQPKKAAEEKEIDKVEKGKDVKKTQSVSDKVFEKLMRERKIMKEKDLKNKENMKDISERLNALKGLGSLPHLKTLEATISTDTSQSFVYGQVESEDTKYIVRGTSLKPYVPHHKQEKEVAAQPALYFEKEISLEDLDEQPDAIFKGPEEKTVKIKEGSGIIRYQLSNRDFIDKGWTKLPTKKIMRRMNIYRMQPAYPQYDWFRKNKEKKVMFYDTGQRLAEIDDDGRGKWFYKNGSIALEYYNAEDMLVGQRYVVYSSGEECEGGRRKPTTVLALFDFLGNGIVYDYNGNVRLKYNQSEGIVVDPKIGAPSRWKWHTLNEPPVLQQVFVNSRLSVRDPYIETLGNEFERPLDSFTKQAQTDMLQVELDNFVKEKSQKLMQRFKPFRIKMKAAKLNDQFALKILDQSNISLLFRDGRTSLKLNLGMNLNNHEIIDTDISDATEVSTPYDKLPAKTESIANIQSILHFIKKTNKPHHLFESADMSSRISL